MEETNNPDILTNLSTNVGGTAALANQSHQDLCSCALLPLNQSINQSLLSNVRHGCPIARARGSCIKR